MNRALLLALALPGGASCGPDEPEQPALRLQAIVAFPPSDTIRLSLPARTQWCTDGTSLLLEALQPEGSGVLIRLRYRDSLASDSLPIVVPADTTTTPAAVVAIKFFTNDTPRGYSLDSGTVRLRRGADAIALTAAGSGIQNAIRIRARLESRDVPIGADSVSCGQVP